MKKILMVCLGNICRSPMAEGAVRHAAAARGIALEVDSAGTGGWHVGEAPDPRAIAICQSNGVAIGDLRARQIAAEDFTRFDAIFALDGANLIQLQQMAPPEAATNIWLFGEFSDIGSVADPYYGDANSFDDCWRQIDRAAQALVEAIGNGEV